MRNPPNNFPRTPLVLTLLFFGLSVSAFFFLLRVINNSHQESQAKELAWQTENARRNELKMLDSSIKIIEPERAQLETHFAQSSNVVPFLDTIETLASQVGAKAEISSVDISKDRTGLMVGMKTLGTFGSLYKFLTLLENSPYELEVLSMEMHRETTLDASNNNATIPKWNGFLKLKLLSFVP